MGKEVMSSSANSRNHELLVKPDQDSVGETSVLTVMKTVAADG